MKVKIITSNETAEKFEQKLNDFIANVKLKDIKFTEILTLDGRCYTSAYIIYDEKD